MEFLVAVWLVVTIAFGGADFSRIVTLKMAAQSAANAGANFAAQMAETEKSCPPTLDVAGARQAAVNDFNGYVNGFTATATVKCGSSLVAGALTAGPCACNATTATFIQVDVQAPFNTIANYPFIPSNLPVRSQDIARVQ